jgi:hypothetical protein
MVYAVKYLEDIEASLREDLFFFGWINKRYRNRLKRDLSEVSEALYVLRNTSIKEVHEKYLIELMEDGENFDLY